MTIRAVCTDIDGTLLDERRALSERTISVFKKIKDQVAVILASSRMPAAMTHLQAEMQITGHPLIAYNGGYVIRYIADQRRPEVLDSVVIPVEVCFSIIDVARHTDIHSSLYFEDKWYAPKNDQWTDREEKITKVKATVADPVWVLNQWSKNNFGAHKVMCMGPTGQIKEMKEELHHRHGQDIHIYLSRPTYLELAPRSVSKGSALEMLVEKWFDFPLRDVVAFGDNYNDVELLKTAGLGIAVSNAREEVKAIADQVAEKSTEDGVAKMLETLLQL